MTPVCDFLFASTQTVHGGSEVLWIETARRLAKKGRSVHALLHVSLQGSSSHRDLTQDGITVLPWHAPVPTRVARLKQALLPRSLWRNPPDPAERQLELNPARLTLINQGGNTDGGPWGCRLREWGWPYAMLAHCASNWTWPTQHVWHYAREAYLGAKSSAFVSAANRSITARQLGLSFDGAKIMRNPLNVHVAEPLPWPETTEPWHLACVGRLDPAHKGQDLLLAVLGRSEWRQRQVQLSFFGSGPGEASLRALADNLNLQSVHWRGTVATAEDIWRDHHLAVQTSRQEGLSLALLEAMWCGRPAVATAVGGTAEVVTESRNGWIADAPTEDSLAAALERAWRARENAAEMGRRAAESARSWNGTDPVGDFAAWVEQLADA